MRGFGFPACSRPIHPWIGIWGDVVAFGSLGVQGDGPGNGIGGISMEISSDATHFPIYG